MPARRLAALLAATIGLVAACGDDPAPRAVAPSTTTTARPSTTTAAQPVATTPTTAAIAAPLLAVVNGAPPVAAGDPAGLADQILASEQAIREPSTAPAVVVAAGQLQQIAYRQLGAHPEWDDVVLGRMPAELVPVVNLHTAARREFRSMHTRLSDHVPAWRIVEPRPADELVAFYQEAEARFGVPWYVLAAVNIVETGLGRIQGLSTAGAQGPMQFLPSTWAAYGLGGNIEDTHDSIMGAANYLAANGGADGNLQNALIHYNRSQHYVNGVLHYAALLQADPRSFSGFHAWRIVYLTTLGDVVLPTGYETSTPIPVADFLRTNPQP